MIAIAVTQLAGLYRARKKSARWIIRGENGEVHSTENGVVFYGPEETWLPTKPNPIKEFEDGLEAARAKDALNIEDKPKSE